MKEVDINKMTLTEKQEKHGNMEGGTVSKLHDTSEQMIQDQIEHLKTYGNNGDMIIKEKKNGKKIAVANGDHSSPDGIGHTLMTE